MWESNVFTGGGIEKSNWLILRLFPGDFDNISALKDSVEGVTAVLFNVLAVTTPWHGTRGDSFKEYHQGCHCIRHSHHDHLFQCCNDGKPRNVPELGPRLPYHSGVVLAKQSTNRVKYWTILRPAFLMNKYRRPTAFSMLPDLIQRRAFLIVYKPRTAMTVVDLGDVGETRSGRDQQTLGI